MSRTLANARSGAMALPPGTIADRVSSMRGGSMAVDIGLVLGGAAFLALATQVRIPLGFTPVPITGQTFAVLLVACALGPVRGPLAVASYVGAGLVGAPVFSQGGSGVSQIVGPTGGYLVGFAVAAAALGWLARAGADRRVVTAIGAMAIGTCIIYVLGAAGLMAATGVGVVRALELGVLPFLGVDALKAGMAALLLPATWAAIARTERTTGEEIARGRKGAGQ